MKKKKVLWKLGPNERKEYLNLAGSFLNIVQVKKKTSPNILKCFSKFSFFHSDVLFILVIPVRWRSPIK